ncbi:MAG: quinolinate synthase [Deltaproteobacteria bacterium RIFCSPLOWO2_02_FULL_53_8]|nr:MAG: quinolinate synthase [Deltaproteobacteria bacterium RIFCSPLOWO2_02_FULL_53_8]
MKKDNQALKTELRALLKERDAIMLAHNYQRDEVQEAADITGDSLALSQAAADSPAKVIVFCGVHFMAESAAILSPQKTVILPRLDAGCPMADMITADDLAKEKAKRPGVPIVAYVNTTAAVKALSDICCTSANAVAVVNSLKTDAAYMIPDKNLSHFVSRTAKKRMEWWNGYCPTHERLTPADVATAKKAHPDALFVCHPECNPAVVDMADHVCSTSGMYTFAKKTSAKTLIVGTEQGILYKLKKENPEKTFIIPSKALICPNMKLTTLEDVVVSLREMRNVVTVPDNIREAAKAALDAMLRVPRDY